MSSDDKPALPPVEQRNVLIPIDASPNCERAFNWYLENLKTDKDVIYFVHVIEPAYSSLAVGLAMESSPIMVDDMTRVMEESVALGKKLGQKYMKLAKNANMAYKAFLHVDSKPGPAIVRSAADHQVQLIVIGSRGLGAIKRTILGSVSDYIVHNSHVPVAVIPPAQGQK
ncbi:hypothetical protein Aperf_G00000032759 [Anoplocephala perfoliata]